MEYYITGSRTSQYKKLGTKYTLSEQGAVFVVSVGRFETEKDKGGTLFMSADGKAC